MKASDELYIDHEIRLRMVERDLGGIKKLLWSILGIAVTSVLMPVLLYKFGIK